MYSSCVQVLVCPGSPIKTFYIPSKTEKPVYARACSPKTLKLIQYLHEIYIVGCCFWVTYC